MLQPTTKPLNVYINFKVKYVTFQTFCKNRDKELLIPAKHTHSKAK